MVRVEQVEPLTVKSILSTELRNLYCEVNQLISKIVLNCEEVQLEPVLWNQFSRYNFPFFKRERSSGSSVLWSQLSRFFKKLNFQISQFKIIVSAVGRKKLINWMNLRNKMLQRAMNVVIVEIKLKKSSKEQKMSSLLQ